MIASVDGPHGQHAGRPRPRRSSGFEPGQKVTRRGLPRRQAARRRAQARRAPARTRRRDSGPDERRSSPSSRSPCASRVRRALGSHAVGARTRGESAGGDVTFAIDADAEEFLEGCVAARAPDVAFYSEDRGLVEPPGGEPSGCSWSTRSTARGRRWRGSRRRACRWRSRPLGEGEPTMGDVVAGCVVEIKCGEWFVGRARRGLPSPTCRSRLSANTDLDRLFWIYGFRGRPARADVEVLGELIDRSSVGGGDVRARLGRLRPDARRSPASSTPTSSPGRAWWTRCRGCGRSSSASAAAASLNNSPYDLAAAALCAARRAAPSSPTPPGRRSATGRCSAPGRLSDVGASRRLSPRLASSCLLDEVERGMERLRTLDMRGRALSPDYEVDRRAPARRRWPTRAWPTTPTSSAGRSIEEIRELAEPLQGKRVLHLSRHRVRRRRVGDPLHARPADARRRPRGRVAGDLRARGVLQRHQAHAQRAPGQPAGPHRGAVGDLAAATTR